MKKLVVFSDGGSRGNPGPSGIGFVVLEKRKELMRFSKTIGHSTNNVAEYNAILEALRWILENFSSKEQLVIDCYLDSLLVVKQLQGRFKIKDLKMKELAAMVKEAEKKINGKVIYHLVPREKNKIADLLVNKALDESL